VIDVDVVVVGAGAMGSATAWRLASDREREVVVLERFGPGHDRGSSHGSTRIFRVAYRDARYVHLAVRALPLWRELEDASGEVLLEQIGQVDHGHPTAIEEIAGHLEGTNHPAQVLRPDQAAERWPGMRFDRSVVFSPEGGRCFADRTVAACQRLAVEAGAELHFRTPVERLEVDGDRAVVHTPDGTWRAPVVVIAAGAWVAPLLASAPDMGLPPIVVESDQPSHFRALDPESTWPAFLHHMGDGGVDHPLAFHAYGLPSPGEGVKVGGYGTVVPDDPERRGGISAERTAEQVRYVQRWLPGVDPTPVSTTSCLFTTTPDEHFVLDRRGPVVVCSPCSGHGFKFVPAIADEVVSLVAGRPQHEPAWRLR
jgi:sarcosine oxidase